MSSSTKRELPSDQSGQVSEGFSPVNSSALDVVHTKETIHSAVALGQMEASAFDSTGNLSVQELPADPEIYCPTTNCCYDGSSEERGCPLNGEVHDVPLLISFQGNPPDANSMVYCVPGYDPYSCGQLVAPGGQYLGKPPVYAASHPIKAPPSAIGTNGMPPVVGDLLTAPVGFSHVKTNADGNFRAHSKHLDNTKLSNSSDSNALAKPSLDDPSDIPGASVNLPAHLMHSKPLKSMNEVPKRVSGFQTGHLAKCSPLGKLGQNPDEGKGGLISQNGSRNFVPNCGRSYGKNTFRVSGNACINSSSNKFMEQNRGPRASKVKDSLAAEEILDKLSPAMRRDRYNLIDFATKYDDAFFFVIKSFSEDDVHKSIKYNVWSSTPSGNEKLDSAFHIAEERSTKQGSRCPVFLFFSVNASGHFCGLAEMVGKVDFKTNMDFWQDSRWIGFFPVKWHIIKDIPNSQLQHIILENNENKAVTNSRDTQEIKFSQGFEMLKIFKNYAAKISILDDFGYYERNEKLLMSKRNVASGLRFPLNSQMAEVGTDKTKNFEKDEKLITLTKKMSISPFVYYA